MNQSNGSSTATEDLLPHEQRARDLMLERNKVETTREVNIRGNGPESTRAGRPLPLFEKDRLAIARSSVAKKKAQELNFHRKERESTQGAFKIRYGSDGVSRPTMMDSTSRQSTPVSKRDEQASQGGFKIRYGVDAFSRHTMMDGTSRPSTKPTPVSERDEEASQWGQLKRKQETPVQNPPNELKVRFMRGRGEREELAKSRSYTPLGSTSIFQSQSGDIGSRNQPSNSLQTGDSRIASPDSQPIIYRPLLDTSRPQVLDKDETPTRQKAKFETATQEEPEQRQRRQPARFTALKPAYEEPKQEEPEERHRRQPARFTALKPAYEAAPKGKDRDKARRRQRFVEEDEEGDDSARLEARIRAEEKKRRKAEKAAMKASAPTPILLPEYISISNLAVALRIRYEDFVERLEELGYEETSHDYILNSEDSGLIAMEFNFEAIIDRGYSEDLTAREPAVDPASLPPRPPVVTIMGHVDHGKTTLLDWLRKSSVAATEHGGITQHIGAFSVPMPSGKTITFLDTPGHAAFLSMRQRGANVTDIVILVVAADDSVKPQTIEAINHAKSAKVPIIVAINKVDKPEIHIDRVKQDLARHGVEIEDFGGDTQVVCVSGKTGQGMDDLEEAAITLSEILDMRAETDGPAEGWVLEASIKSMGKVATVLVRRGTVRPGDFIVAGNTWARIRCLRNEAGVEIEEAGPGTPVEIDGWREQPVAGDEVLQAPDEAKAKSVVDYRLEKIDRDKMAEDMEAVNLTRKADQDKREKEKEAASLASRAKDEEDTDAPVLEEEKKNSSKTVYFIVKGDVSGSVEAVIDSVSQVGNNEVAPHILRAGVGQLSEFDVEHAAAAKGHLINFNTPVDPHIARLADQNKVSILDYNIIYRLVDGVKEELSKHLAPLVTQRVTGEAEIAQAFDIKMKRRQVKSIAGCKIRNGAISRSSKVRVLRNDKKVFDGMCLSLLLNFFVSYAAAPLPYTFTNYT